MSDWTPFSILIFYVTQISYVQVRLICIQRKKPKVALLFKRIESAHRQMLFSAFIGESLICREHQWIQNTWLTQLLWKTVKWILRSKEYSFAILSQLPRNIAEDKAEKNASSKGERKFCKNAISFASYICENKELKEALLNSLWLKKKWAPS